MEASGRKVRSRRLQALGLIILSLFALTMIWLVFSMLLRPDKIVPINLIYYGVHNKAEDSLILRIRPEYAVVNTRHGLWGEKKGLDECYFLQSISEYQSAGIKVIGYISAGYEGKDTTGSIDQEWYSLETNKRFILNMATADRVDGVFIDECSAFPGPESKAYLKELADLAHTLGLIVWGNVGTDDFDPWFFTEGGFDLIHSSESWDGQDLSQVQMKWGHRISVSGYDPEYIAKDAADLTLNAWSKGIAYCYVSDADYASLSPWVEEYVSLLRKKTFKRLVQESD
ncbi:MAG: hypothetical protein IBX68_04610 [Dehalococcoidia bacterium]|nr:hypothetical protein [Dehalococcoidia bacterium]